MTKRILMTIVAKSVMAGIIGAVLAVALVFGVVEFASHSQHYMARSSASASEINSADLGSDREITISAVGDCVLGTDARFSPSVSFNHYRQTLGMSDDYFFGGVRDILDKDDLTIANCECVLADPIPPVHKPHQRGGQFWFRGDPDNAKIFVAGSVEAVNLANNHSFDYGEAGLQETVDSLQAQGVVPYGNGIKQIITRKGIKIGLVGYAVMGPLEQGVNEELLKAQIESDLDELRPQVNLLFVTFHWGIESLHVPTPQQRRLGHFAVDHGANLVIGHHPHVLQPIETYHGVTILYSLGNFVYGGSDRVQDPHTIIYQHTFRFSGIDKLIGQSSRVIPCLVHAGFLNDYRPILASQAGLAAPSAITSQIPADFVELDSYLPEVIVDLRYAGSNNRYNHAFYDTGICYLRRPVADRLGKANSLAAEHGMHLKVWDAYRPYAVQKEFQKYVSDPRWIAQGISNHNRGAAVDVTLVDDAGVEMDMGTDFDEFSARSRVDARGLTPAQTASRRLLRSIMVLAGFRPLATEWWHFDAPDARRFAPVDARI